MKSIPKSDISFRCAEYLLNNSDGLKDAIINIRSAYNNRDLETVADEIVVTRVIHTLTEALGLTYEDIANVITDDYLIALLGKEWFRAGGTY